MSEARPVQVAGIPLTFGWSASPESWDVAAGAISIEAGPRTDLFVDPRREGPPILNAPRLLAAVDGDFLLSARVTVDFSATYDAGVLLLWGDETRWAKLCFEYSPRAEPMIVSVVTRGVSDDCDSTVLASTSTWLRIARVGRAYAFHASDDGRAWRFVRHFALDGEGPVAVGLEAQSPVGSGCRVVFDHLRFEARRLADLRSGE